MRKVVYILILSLFFLLSYAENVFAFDQSCPPQELFLEEQFCIAAICEPKCIPASSNVCTSVASSRLTSERGQYSCMIPGPPNGLLINGIKKEDCDSANDELGTSVHNVNYVGKAGKFRLLKSNVYCYNTAGLGIQIQSDPYEAYYKGFPLDPGIVWPLNTKKYCKMGGIYAGNDDVCYYRTDTPNADLGNKCYMSPYNTVEDFLALDTNKDMKISVTEASSLLIDPTNGACIAPTSTPGPSPTPNPNAPTSAVQPTIAPCPTNGWNCICSEMLGGETVLNESQLDECEKCLGKNEGAAGNADGGRYYYTAVGCVDSSEKGITTRVFQIGIGLIGGFSLFRVIQSVFMMQSRDPEKIKAANSNLGSAFWAFIMLVGAVLILNYIGTSVIQLFTGPILTSPNTPTVAPPPP